MTKLISFLTTFLLVVQISLAADPPLVHVIIPQNMGGNQMKSIKRSTMRIAIIATDQKGVLEGRPVKTYSINGDTNAESLPIDMAVPEGKHPSLFLKNNRSSTTAYKNLKKIIEEELKTNSTIDLVLTVGIDGNVDRNNPELKWIRERASEGKINIKSLIVTGAVYERGSGDLKDTVNAFPGAVVLPLVNPRDVIEIALNGRITTRPTREGEVVDADGGPDGGVTQPSLELYQPICDILKYISNSLENGVRDVDYLTVRRMCDGTQSFDEAVFDAALNSIHVKARGRPGVRVKATLLDVKDAVKDAVKDTGR